MEQIYFTFQKIRLVTPEKYDGLYGQVIKGSQKIGHIKRDEEFQQFFVLFLLARILLVLPTQNKHRGKDVVASLSDIKQKPLIILLKYDKINNNLGIFFL